MSHFEKLKLEENFRKQKFEKKNLVYNSEICYQKYEFEIAI